MEELIYKKSVWTSGESEWYYDVGQRESRANI